MYNNYNNSPNLIISIPSVVSSQQKTFFNAYMKTGNTSTCWIFRNALAVIKFTLKAFLLIRLRTNHQKYIHL